MKVKGYAGKILCFDLAHFKVTVEDLNEEWVKQFVGRNTIIF